MGKLDKAEGERAIRRFEDDRKFSVDRAATMYDKQPTGFTTAARTDNGQYAPRTIRQSSSLEVQRLLDQQQAFPYQQDVYSVGQPEKPQDPKNGSQKGRKPGYRNKPPRGRGKF